MAIMRSPSGACCVSSSQLWRHGAIKLVTGADSRIQKLHGQVSARVIRERCPIGEIARGFNPLLQAAKVLRGKAKFSRAQLAGESWSRSEKIAGDIRADLAAKLVADNGRVAEMKSGIEPALEGEV